MYCQCGCGQLAPLASKTMTARGWVKGQPIRFINKHYHRPRKILFVVDPVTHCWNWVGSKYAGGYGHIRVNKRLVHAHRHYFELAKGPIPDGYVVDHLCRNHACVNPEHLEAVTQAMNVQRSVSTRLTMDIVRQIRAEYATGEIGQVKLGEKYGIAFGYVSRIVNGHNWKEQSNPNS